MLDEQDQEWSQAVAKLEYIWLLYSIFPLSRRHSNIMLLLISTKGRLQHTLRKKE